MKGTSLNISDELIQKLKEVFPGAFSEGKIDIEQLQLILGEVVNSESERYQLSWAGKTEAYKLLQKPASSTLLPNPEQSIDWDNAEHLFIEGENLEVLKVIQKAYYGKIKMIYIDPPYNTGSDSFIYPDKFGETKEEYLKRIGDKNDSGLLLKEGAFRKNNKENGQFHSNWLNMMLPRLYIARNLLRGDGIIFISIDDNEQANLKLLMDEVFGEENFVANMVRENKAGAGHDSGMIAIEYDYILMYSKNKSKVKLNKKIVDVENDPKYRYEDEYVNERGKYYLRDLDYRGNYSVSGDYPIRLPNGKEIFSGGKFGPPNTWRWSKDKLDWGLKNGFIVTDDEKEKVYIKQYQYVDNGGKRYVRTIPFRALTKFMNGKGSQEVDELLGPGIFSFPKSVELLQYLIKIASDQDGDIIMDFFAGSGTTAHAVLELNHLEKKKRKFLCIQLPEKVAEESQAHKLGYKTVSEITLYRIKSVINKIGIQDCGFRKFTLAPSNFKNWRSDAIDNEDMLRKLLVSHKNSQMETAQLEDILWEILIKNGSELDRRLLTTILQDKTKLYFTADGAYAFALDRYSPELENTIIDFKPKILICSDRIFNNNDALKTNLELKLADNHIAFKSL